MPGTAFEQTEWWEQVVGEPPDTRNSQPKVKFFQEQGPLDGGVLTLGILPGRFDWILSSITESGLPGVYTDIARSFRGRLSDWLRIGPPVHRLAFGAILHQPVANALQGTICLSKYLSTVKVDPETMSDLLFRVNRPMSFPIDGAELRINRISKWDTLQLSTTTVTVGAGAGDLALATSSLFCRLELDISTDQDRKTQLPQDLLPVVFQQMVDIGIGISERGDTP
jgi:hypothetical protein